MPIINLLNTSLNKQTTLGLLSVSLIVVSICAVSPARIFAQEESSDVDDVQTTEVEKKVIHEPVHRVPKVASNTSLPKKDAGSVADNVQKNNVPAVLPSAKTIVEPATSPVPPTTELPATTEVPTTEPAAEPLPNKSKVPAISASTAKPVPAPHPLDDALDIARRGLENIRANVKDYSAIMVKRERVDGELLKPEYMQLKVRSAGVSETGAKIPFSVYMKFIKPRGLAGREVIWVDGQNENRMCVHEGSGLMSFKRLNLVPDGWIAMKGQRYPVYDAGMENLVVKLIEKAERDKAAGDCEVVYRDGVKINGRACSVIEVTHPHERKPYDFHIAKVYIDDELRLPIRYQAHLWPTSANAKPQLLEEYTYLNVKINQGFTDEDFNPENPAYSYPKR